ncbi:MAG TPA: hypothetical protein VLH75_07290 [Longimicrobiales bacterium]|nr:hypothetical protein [Longimicrobiales bacterium]
MLDIAAQHRILPGVDFSSQGSARVYSVTKDTELVALRVDAPMPFAPDGSWVYVFVYRKRRVGRWDWARDETGIERIIEAYRTGTSPDYEPPEWRAPGGEEATLRPPIRDLVARAMEEARPGPEPAKPRIRLLARDEET